MDGGAKDDDSDEDALDVIVEDGVENPLGEEEDECPVARASALLADRFQ